MKEEQSEGLVSLGSQKTEYPTNVNPSLLECFINRNLDREYMIGFDCLEGNSCCAKTKQPDMWKLKIDYIPDKKCIETKSLKLYLFGYRNENTFFEPLVNRVRDDLVKVSTPKYLRIYGTMNIRGGISIECMVQYTRDGYLKEQGLDI